MLTVAIDVGPLVGHRTGIGLAVSAMVDALRARDDVHLVPYLTSARAPAARLEELGAVRLPLPASLAHRTWATFGRPRVDAWLAGADVVHGTNYVVPPARVPRVVSVYDCWFLDRPDLAQPAVARAGRVLLRSLGEGAVAHVSSAATAERLRAHAASADVRVVPLAALVVPEPVEPPVASVIAGRPFVLSIGALERRKNVPSLVRAFGMVAVEHRDVCLVIGGGDGDDRSGIDAAIAELPAEARARVMVIGRVDEGGRGWLLRHASVLAYPSLDEGFGFPLLDAMQVDLPVVATRAGSIPEVAGDAALLVALGDDVALAEALGTALTDDAERVRLAAAGRVRVAAHSWQHTADGLLAIYGSLR